MSLQEPGRGDPMMTRRDLLRAIPAPMLLSTARAPADPPPTRIDAHVHIHRDAPALIEAMKTSGWRGLDIVVSPASVAGEASDLGARLLATARAARESGGALAWASTFDARVFE